MQTESISINVSAKAAEAFRKAPPATQRHIQELLEFSLVDDEGPDDTAFGEATAELEHAAAEMGQNARCRGLTDDKLDAILNEPKT